MQSAAKKPFLLKYQGKSIPRRLALSDKISQIILMARPLFNLSNEDNLHLRINGQDQEGDKTLEELGLKGAEEIEVILMTSTPQDLSNICFCIKSEKDSDFHDWAVSLTKKLIEAKREFCASQGIDSALYNLSIDGTSIDENLILSEIPDLEDIVFTFEKKQEKRLEEEVDIRDIRLLVSGSEVYELPLNWLAKVKLLKALVTQDLDFPPNVTQQWSIEGKELNDEDSLKSQMRSENSTIDIDRLTPFSFNIVSESQTVNKTILMDSSRTVGFLKQNKELASIINSKSQFWFINDSKEPLQDDRHLLDYTEDQTDLVIYVKEQTESSPRTKSQIKKIYSFKYKNSVLKKQFSLDEDVGVVTQSIVKSLNISGSTRLSLNFKDNMLEPTKSLSDYMKGPEGVISIVPVEDETNCVKLTFLFNDEQKEVSAKYSQSIKELRDEVCSTFAIDNSYHYSIFLDLQRLELSQLIKEVENLGEESVLELQAVIEIKIASQANPQSAKTTLIFSPNKKIDDLKTYIQAKKLTNSAEFDLCLGQRPLEGTQMLGHYIQNDDEVIITIVERMSSNHVSICQINLKLCDIEANLTKLYSLKEDSQTLVSTLKKLAGPELSVKPARQCWMIDNTELLDHLALKDYLERNTDSVNIDVYILHDFLLLTSQQESPISMSLALNTRISDIKEKIKAKYEHIGLEKTKLQAYQHVLEEEKSLKDYMNLWNDHNRPTISVLKAVNLTIIFNAKPEVMCFSAQAGAGKVKDLIKQKLALQDHDIELWEGERRVDDKELETILQHQIEKVLTCKKMKSVIISYADQETFEEKLCLDSRTTLGYFKSKAKEKLKISEESCEILFNGIAQKEDIKTLDEIDPSLFLLRFTVQSVKELEVVNNDQRYKIHYAPSESVEDIKERLKEKGFTDADKFSLWLNQQIVSEGQPLRSYGISYEKHILTSKLKKTILVVLPFEQKEYTYGEDTTTVGDLKKKIEKLDGIPANKQILILLKDKEWHRRLIDTNEKIADIEEENITILCRTSKKFAIIFGINGKLDVFEGMYGAVIQEQKKLFEIVYNVPIINQIWSIGLGTSSSAKFMEDTLSIESYGIQGFDEANPIRVYRKINLTVCLSQKSETLEDLPTYETIGAQKLKISKKLAILPEDQLWSYNEKELEDEKMLEDYFTTSHKEDSSRDVNAYAVDLVVQNDLEYFGFTEKNEINVDLFTSFFIESDEELDKIIQSVSFNKKESSLQFRNKLLGLFFGVLKKHSMWENLISKIKKRTFDIKGVNLWKSNEKNKTVQSKFNTQFLLYYFLNSGTPELNVEMLSIMKMHFPVPLAINSWTNRFSVEGMKVLDVLYWIMQKSFVVTSFGIGGAETKVCGKSELNNQILFSNFVKDSERNQICKGCPEILFDIYKNDKFPVNLVDIPSDTNEEIRNRIIENSNMLIIHSLADQNQTLEYLTRLPNKVPTIILYRDIHRAFSHIGVFRENLTNSLKAAFSTGVFEIKIADLRDDDRSNELNEISSKVQEYILTTFQATNDSDLWRFFNFLEGYDEHFNTILDKIRSNSSQLVQAIPIFNDLKKLERNETISEKARQDELTRLNQSLDKNLLAPEINELIRLLVMFEFLPSIICSESPKLFLEKLQDYLRMMKSQQTKDFFKLYEFKSALSEASSSTMQKTIEQFCQYWDAIKKQNYHYQGMEIAKDSTKQQVDSLIEKSIEIFEQKIIPNIFSIELFWRELIYFTNLKKNYEVSLTLNRGKKVQKESVQLYDFLVKLKRENIFSGFPFEVIDGDLLYMPKEFFKNVFKGFNDRVIIISVLGPQSSGKSTLLNFLFGCNFVTSSGRCTKGIYGTYFKVSNFNSCDGILVLDTEGLFGLLNKNEEQHRDKFDRKLVLFCLAMSDFVLINFKGDIDKTLTEVLMVCRDSLTKLQQGNIQIPEMFLILNQNAQTNINTQLQDINKMSELGFSLTNVDILPLAFETHLDESAAIAKFMDPVLKKTPKKEFSEKCKNLAQKIFDKINSNVNGKGQRTLENAMDRMEHLWELLNKFPDLLKHTTMRDQAQEKNIKDWIDKEVDEKLRAKFAKTVEDFKNNPNVNIGWEQKFKDQFTEEETRIIREFNDIFQEKTNPGLFTEMENTLLSHTGRVRTQLINELNYHAHQKKMKIYDIQGVETIREAARMVKNKQNMSESEKNKCFEQVWTDIVENLANSYNREKESNNLFQIVKENYKTNLHTLKAVLPSTNFPLDTELSFESYREKMLKMVHSDYILEKAFEYTKQAPALIFRGGKGNIIFKYFDLKKYFDYEDAEEFIGLPKNKIYELFNVNKLREEISGTSKQQESEVVRGLLEKVKKELDSLGIYIATHLLQKTLDYKRQGILNNIGRWMGYVQPVQHNEINHNTCRHTEDKYQSHQNYQGHQNYHGHQNNSHQNYHSYQNYQGHQSYQSDQTYYLIWPELIRKKAWEKKNYRATYHSFFDYVLLEGINWLEIVRVLDKELLDVYRNYKVSQMSQQISQDLKKLNLQFIEPHRIQERVLAMFRDVEEYKWEINEAIAEASSYVACESLKDLYNQDFTYLKKEALQASLQKISPENTSQYFIVTKWKGKKLTVKKEFQHISWLESYAKEELDRIFINTTQNWTLLEFVFNQFSFKSLLQDVFESCINTLAPEDNWTYNTLYQTITRETNDLIGIANNDLQQVSYRLDFKLVGHIHLAVTCLVWKFFEQKNWAKITEPLVTMKSKKDQQKKYFDAMASANHIQINAVEAEKSKQNIESYITNTLITRTTKDLIASTAKKFHYNMSRKHIQDEIDAKYFSRNATAGNDELYYYMLNPREVLLKAYEETSKSYIQSMQTEMQQKNVDLNSLLQVLLQRITSIQQILNSFGEEFWALDNIFEFKEYKASEKNEVLFSKYENNLGAIYYSVVLALLKGDKQIFSREHQIDPSTKVTMKKNDSLKITPLSNQEISDMIYFLGQQSGKVTNALLFVKSLYDQINQLTTKSAKFFDLSHANIKEFQDKINIFICKQKCPCCDRICDVEDPNHNTHQCRYGHQIRAIGGVMLSNLDASVSRCEDIGDIDKMMYNGQEMTWMEFKHKMKTQGNNPWNLDNLSTTKNDAALREKFKLAWTLIGNRICSERYKASKMKYVPYNQATIDGQRVVNSGVRPRQYIYMIDSSASMSSDNRWTELLQSLKQTLGQIHNMNKDNRVTILNFSTSVKVEYVDTPPNSINVDALTFQNGGTTFEAAFASGFEEIQRITKNDITLIFMTDGEDSYPRNSVNNIKGYLGSSRFKDLNIKFDFNAIGFKCNSSILNDLAQDLGGTTRFADSGAQLTKAFMEILNRQEEQQNQASLLLFIVQE